jgi:DNA-binding NarL/FixJ family response regulator
MAEGMGADPLQAEIERLATRARLELAGPETGDAAGSTVGTDLGLTRREVEVLGHLAAGRTDREIAESLFISKKTVSVHVSSVLRKLDVPNRVEAGRVGQALGVIESAGQR